MSSGREGDHVLVLGGGPNGLAAATLLAQHGGKVTVLEAQPVLGGLAAPREFHPSYRAPGFHLDASRVRPFALAALGVKLERRSRPDLVLPSRDGKEIRVRQDVDDGLSGDVTARDREGFASLRGFVNKVKPVLLRVVDRAPLSVRDSLWSLFKTGFAARRLGATTLTELLRMAPMAVADWMRDTLETERLRAGLAFGALEGAFTGPWSAHSALLLLLREAMSEGEIVGGPAAVAAALEARARAVGVVLRTSARVAKVLCDDDGVTGVRLLGGEVLESASVLSTLDPKQTLDLVGPPFAPLGLADAMRAYRMRGVTSVVWLALNGPLETRAGTKPEALRTGDTLDEIERAWDAAKYRTCAERPALDVRVPSVADEALCPQGHSVVTLHASGVAASFDERDFGARVVKALAEVCPSVSDRVVAVRVWTPQALASEHGLTGGHLWHGEHAPDQFLSFRPAIGAGRYATPIPGLHLGGGGTHPGGGLHLANGVLAARTLAKWRAI